MKSYDEIYQNVLRRRDEHAVRKRRRLAVIGSLLPVAAVSVAAVAGAAALQGKLPTEYGAGSSGSKHVCAEESTLTFLCGTKHTTHLAFTDNGGTLCWSNYDSSKLKPPARVTDGRLIFTADGQHIDITDITSEQTPYIYETTNPYTELPDIFIIGGTPENFGWIENLMYDEDYPSMPEHSHWISDSDNIFVETAEGVEYREWCVNGIKQLRQNSRYAGISDTYIGGNSTVTEYSQYDYTASLRLIGVTHRPDADDDRYAAWDAVITVTDPKGRTAVTSVNSACDIYGYLFDDLDGSHIEKSLKIYQIEYGGEPHHVLVLRKYHKEDSGAEKYICIFFAIEEECFEDGNLRIYKSGAMFDPSPNAIVLAAEEFDTEGNTLIDSTADDTNVHFYEFTPDKYYYQWYYEKKS